MRALCLWEPPCELCFEVLDVVSVVKLFGSIRSDIMISLSMPLMCHWWWAGTVVLICLTLSIVMAGCEAVRAPPFLTFALCGMCASDMMWLGTNACFEALSTEIERWSIMPDPKRQRASTHQAAVQQIRAKLTGSLLDLCIFTSVWPSVSWE